MTEAEIIELIAPGNGRRIISRRDLAATRRSTALMLLAWRFCRKGKLDVAGLRAEIERLSCLTNEQAVAEKTQLLKSAN